MRRTLLLTALFALLLATATDASAATRYTIKGGGWGHGIGMSQYGAWGLAENGRSYREILAHYYTGTNIGTASSRPGRVLLQPNDPYIRIRGAAKLSGGKKLKRGTTYIFKRGGAGIRVRTSGGKSVGSFPAPLRVSGSGRAMRLLGPAGNGVSNGVYRGDMELTTALGGVSAINRLPLDDYVLGVVPSEMPSAWHMEGLKAQAVAARSYALATDKSGIFDQYADTRSQVYRGVTGETRRASAAVRATRREIVTYDGEVAVTYFFSTSGGRTENIENAFIGSPPSPYLKSVKDPYDTKSPYHKWRLSMSASTLDAKLGGYSPGRFKKIKIVKRGVSPRIVRARVYGSGGNRTISGPTLRTRLGLRDTWASFSKVSSSQARTVHFAKWATKLKRLTLEGQFAPAPRSGRITVERRSRGKWHKVRKARVSRAGAYSVRVGRKGVYRVHHRDVLGPAVRVK